MSVGFRAVAVWFLVPGAFMVLAPASADADKLELVGNMVINLTGGEYQYDSVYVDATSSIRLRGDTKFVVAGPVTINGKVGTDWDHEAQPRDGANGAPGADGAGTSLDKGHGDPGLPGGTGGSGLNSYSLRIEAAGDVRISGEIDLAGGDGGNGGNGGTGHDGLWLLATDPSDPHFGNGGAGGDGGVGGDGGNGGSFEVYSLFPITVTSSARFDLSGGNGGLGGIGGDGGNATLSYVEAIIAAGGDGGNGGVSGNGGKGGGLTLVSGGCVTLDGSVEIDLSGGSSPDPFIEGSPDIETPTGGHGGDGGIGWSWSGSYDPGGGGRGVEGGQGGAAGVFVVHAAGDIMIDQPVQFTFGGGDGGNGGLGGFSGNGPDTANSSCMVASGGIAGDGGGGGDGGNRGRVVMSSAAHLNFEADLELYSGSGGNGGDGGGGGNAGSTTWEPPPNCGYFSPGVGGHGGNGGHGGQGGGPYLGSLELGADESILLSSWKIGYGDGGNGGNGGYSGASGTALGDPTAYVCPMPPGKAGDGGNAHALSKLIVTTGFFQEEVGIRENVPGAGGIPGGLPAVVHESCSVSWPDGNPGIFWNGGAGGIEPTLDLVRMEYDPYGGTGVFRDTVLTYWDAALPWADGVCEACLPWADTAHFPCDYLVPDTTDASESADASDSGSMPDAVAGDVPAGETPADSGVADTTAPPADSGPEETGKCSASTVPDHGLFFPVLLFLAFWSLARWRAGGH